MFSGWFSSLTKYMDDVFLCFSSSQSKTFYALFFPVHSCYVPWSDVIRFVNKIVNDLNPLFNSLIQLVLRNKICHIIWQKIYFQWQSFVHSISKDICDGLSLELVLCLISLSKSPGWCAVIGKVSYVVKLFHVWIYLYIYSSKFKCL